MVLSNDFLFLFQLYLRGGVLRSSMTASYVFRFRSATFEITSTDVGKFEISGKFLGIEVQRVELVFQVSAKMIAAVGGGGTYS